MTIYVIIFIEIFSDFLENENWGGECDTGRRQSPIDLDHDASVKGRFLIYKQKFQCLIYII